MQPYRVGWRDAGHRLIYIQFIRGCTIQDAIEAVKEWRTLSESVPYQVGVIINVIDVVNDSLPGSVSDYITIARIVPTGTHEIAIVGANDAAFHLISGIVRMVYPTAINHIHFFDTIDKAEMFLKWQARA